LENDWLLPTELKSIREAVDAGKPLKKACPGVDEMRCGTKTSRRALSRPADTRRIYLIGPREVMAKRTRGNEQHLGDIYKKRKEMGPKVAEA